MLILRYYRIVISLVAKTSNSLCFIASRISPRLIVRGQNPGKFLGPTKVAEPQKFEVVDSKNLKRPFVDTYTSSPSNMGQEGWKIDDHNRILFATGKVGINTQAPQEALTVHGNILVTGDVVKPSDQRIKTNIEKVEQGAHLDTIEQIQLYDYDVKSFSNTEQADTFHERGVLAQELQRVLPSAVRVIKGLTLADGTRLPELLVVQDRALLFETIGATQELGQAVKDDRQHVSLLSARVDRHVQVV